MRERTCATIGCSCPATFAIREFDGYDQWIYRWRCQQCVLETHREATAEYLASCERHDREKKLRESAASKLTTEEREVAGL